MLIAALGISLVPAFYLLIYISSVWDPTAHTKDLKVAIVNLDQDYSVNGQTVNVGRDLVADLGKDATFNYVDMKDPKAARDAVAAGQIAFAIEIPPNFSQTAVPGVVAGGAKVVTVISEGNNYTVASLGRRFAVELGHKINETLNKSRWDLVLKTVDKAGDSLKRLNDGVAELRSGAARLDDGAKRYSTAAVEVADGFKQVGDAIRLMDDKMPEKKDLNALVAGTEALAKGQQQLGQGLKTLRAGADKLTVGAQTMQDKSKAIPFAGKKVSEGAQQLAEGGQKLTGGLNSAVKGNKQLATGAKQINLGTEKLVNGVNQLGEGIHTLAEKMPQNTKLDEFSKGGLSLSDGTGQLLAGIDRMVAELPKSIPKPDGTPEGLADSVHSDLQVIDPVPNNGTALVPNMASVALWVGAVMAAYVFQLQMMLVDNKAAGLAGKGLGKYVAPAVLVSLQAIFAYAMLTLAIGVRAPQPLAFAASLIFASLTFLAVIFALIRILGDAGKLIAVLFLTLQLSAGGGIAPVELAGPFYRIINPWLPFTWVVHTLRATLFGAFGDGISFEWLRLLAFGAAALIVAVLFGRWRYVAKQDFRPGVDL
jgi:putative membrane protein